MNRKLKIGLVGCGGHMFHYIYNFLKNQPVELVAICDKSEERMRSFASYYKVDRCYKDHVNMLKKENLDAVVCVADAAVHYQVAKDSMLSGINVFIEKTPCQNTAQAQELIDIQEKTGKFTMVGFNRRFMTSYLMAKEIMARDEFGPLTMYMAKYNASEYHSDEVFVFNHMIHHFDLMRFFLGEIKEMSSNKIKIDEHRVGYHTSFVSDSGVIGFLQSGSLQYEPYPVERVEITGVGRNIIVDNIKHLEYHRPGERRDNFNQPILAEGGDTLTWNLNHNLYSTYTYLGYESELNHFIKYALKDEIPDFNIKDSHGTMRLLDMFRASIR